MGKITLGLANYIDEAVLTGGAWMGTLPLSNVQNRRLSRVARSANALAASTKFDIALSKARRVRCLALIVHNLSVSSTVRVLADDEASFATPLYDSGAVAMWPSGTISDDLLEWEDDNFWLATVSQEAVAGYQAPFIHLLPAAIPARYWRVEINDTANPDGWVHIGRVYIADAWTPDYNLEYGNDLSFEDVSAVETSLASEEFFEARRKRRKFRFNLPRLSINEGYQQALDLERRAGTTGEVLVVADPDDVQNGVRRNFLGRISALSGLQHAAHNVMTKRFEIAEVL
ncbi:hypothetical protein [Azonexus sp.]|uniref:hypothetical protein n=1 Tax=Azonexus sp. TaxID=1872668 RepID=UPI0027B97F4E|nr:hypothetical protein [Azonexus sp.]